MSKTFSLHRVWFLLFFGALTLGQFERFALPGFPALYGHEIILLLANLTVLLDHRIRPSYLGSISGFKLGWLFPAALALSLLVNAIPLGQHFLPASLYFFRFLLYLSLVPLLAALRSDRFIKSLLPYALPSVILALALGGIAQYLFYPDTRLLFWLGWDKHYYRSIGTLFDPNYLGLLMVIGIFLTQKLPRRWQWWYATVLIICLLLTYSRSSYLALILAGFVWTFKQRQVRLFFLGLVAFASLLLVLPNRGGEGNRLNRVYSIINRQTSLQEALAIYRAHPIFGIGFNAYGKTLPQKTAYSFIPQRTSAPDNSFLLILATAGLVGFLALCLTLKQLWLRSQSDPAHQALLAAVLVHSLFNNSLFYPWVMVCLAVLAVKNSR